MTKTEREQLKEELRKAITEKRAGEILAELRGKGVEVRNANSDN